MISRHLPGILLCAVLASATSLVAAHGEDSPLSSDAATDAQRSPQLFDLDWLGQSGFPQWTAAADFIFLERCGGTSRTIVERVPGVPTVDRVPGSTPFGHLFTTPGVEALNGNDFHPGFCGGPRINLIRHADSGYDLELSYYQVDDWRSDKTVVPNDPDECLVMRAPGQWISPSTAPGGWNGWIQTNQDGTQAMAWEYDTQLRNAEVNLRWDPAHRVTMLAGFRWMNLEENLAGALSPPTIATEPPFWKTGTSNNLFGLQIGADGTLWQRGRFSLGGRVKAGVYDNNAQQTTAVSVIAKQVRTGSATTNHAAFVGETGLLCRCRIGNRLELRAGYELIWLEGVALASGQIQETYTTTKVFENAVQAMGVNCSSRALYHGATFGCAYSF